MYFDHCDTPQELSKKISEFLKIATGRIITFGPGKPNSGFVDLIDRPTDETLRQGYAEARNVAEKFRKRNTNLPLLPDVEVLPLKGLISISSWCQSITPQFFKPRTDLSSEKSAEKEMQKTAPEGKEESAEPNKEKAKRLHEIVDALEEWGKHNEKVTNAAEWSTPAAKQIIRKAMKLLVDNLALLNECKNKYGCFNPLTQCFMAIEQAASWTKTKDLGDCRAWTSDFTERHLWGGEKRSLADECIRYANEVDRETEQDTKSEREGMIEVHKPFYKKRWAKIIGVLSGLLLITTLLINLKTIKEWFYPPRIQPSTSKGRQLPLTNENKLSVSLKEICKDINSRPLLQQEETAKRYIGINIQEEHLKLFDIHEYPEDGTFGLTMILPHESDESYLTGRKIFCTVERDKHPQLNAAKRGLEFYVSGQIEDAGSTYIKLSDVSLKFD